MLFSKPVSYAIRALVHLARNREQGAILSTTIASEQDIPSAYVVKILGTLITAGMVTSARGPGGGFSLSRDPERISLYDVMVLFDGVQLSKQCLLGHGPCSDETACAVHAIWRKPKQAIDHFLHHSTIADLARTEANGETTPKPAQSRKFTTV